MPFDPESQRKNSVKNATYIAKMAKKMPDIAEAIKQAKLSGIKLNSNVSYVIFALLFLSAVGSVTYSVLNKDLRESAYDPEQPLPEIDEVAFRDLVSKSISPNTTSQNRREVMMAVDTMPIMEKRRVAVSLSVMSHRMPSIAEKNNNYPLYVSDSSGKKANEEVSLARISSRGFPVRVSDGFRYETESSMYLNMNDHTEALDLFLHYYTTKEL